MRLRTLNRPAEISGIGLHTGHLSTLRLLPREQAGWVFRRVDLPGQPEFQADIESVQQTTWATSLGGTHGLLHCCEHLLATLHGLQIGACTVEVDSDEVPICDGSARPFVEIIERSGIRELTASCSQWKVMRECWVQDGDKHMFAFPAEELRLTYAVDFQHPLAPAQLFSISVTPATFCEELAPARTFALVEWIEDLRNAGLIRGGSLDCAVVIFPDRYSSPLRFPDEMARHKALDLLGDLALLGRPVLGHFVAIKASHALHVELLRKLKSDSGP